MIKLFPRYRKKSLQIGLHTAGKYSYSAMSLGGVNWYQLIRTQALLDVYEQVPDVQFIVNYIANQVSKTSFQMIDGERVIEKHPVIDLLNSPNPHQNWYEFVKQFIAYYEIFGNGYINAFSPVGMLPSSLHLLSPLYVTIKANDTKDIRLKIAEKYIYATGTGTLNIEPQTMLHKKNTNLRQDGDEVLFGQPSLIAGSKIITSILAAYEAKCMYYQKRGALGILSSANSDISNPLTKAEIDEIQKSYGQNYGMNRDQNQIIISPAALSWQSMSLPLNDLQLLESIIADRRTLCGLFNVPALIFTDEAATFSNKKEVIKEVWGTKLLPFLNDFYNDLTNFLKTWFAGTWRLVPDLTNITELKDDEKVKHDMYIADVTNGIRTRNEVRNLLGLQTVPDAGANELTINDKEKKYEGQN